MDEGKYDYWNWDDTINLTRGDRELNLKVQELLKDVPEIEEIVARTGSDELGLDPYGAKWYRYIFSSKTIRGVERTLLKSL